MEVTVPKGYEAQKMVVTYTKKDIVEHTDQYIYESEVKQSIKKN